MRKYLFPVMIVFILVLSACAKQTAAQPTASSTVAPTAAAPAGQPTPAPTVEPYTNAATPCKPLNILNELLPTPDSSIPAVSDQDWIKGPADAKVTFMVYTDLQCPYCAQFDPIINQVLKDFPNDTRLVVRFWPLAQIHDKALLAAQAAEAAGKQGKFFELVDMLFTAQSDWSAKSLADFETYLQEKAPSVGLNVDQFMKDLKDPAIVKKVADNRTANDQLFQALGTKYNSGFGTPTLFINGSLYSDQRTAAILSSIVNLIKNKGVDLPCPATSIDPTKSYTATLTTNKGDIVINLFAKDAPVAVNSFISLVDQKWYDNNAFFVARDQFVISGDKTNTGIGSPGYAYLDEVNPNLKFDKEGMVGMYNFGPGTNGSQFFITKAAMDSLTGHYTVFGQVTQGMDVVKALALHEPDQSLDSADKIISVTVTAK